MEVKNRERHSGNRDTMDLTCPVPSGTAKVMNSGGVNYICVEGYNGYDSNGVSYLSVAAGVYNSSNPAPNSFPGVGGAVEQATVTSGSFNYNTASTFLTGAAATVNAPGAANQLLIWPQYSNGTWSTTPFQFNFNGRYNSQTDCGTGLGEVSATGDPRLWVELPVPGLTAKVLIRNGTAFVCVRGGNAFDLNGNPDFAVAAKLYVPGSPVPTAPPLGDPMTRLVNVDDQGIFYFDSVATYLPGAAAVMGVPGSPNVLALWPQYVDRSWGRPRTTLFYGRVAKTTDCNASVAPRQPCGPCGEKQSAEQSGDSQHSEAEGQSEEGGRCESP